MNQPLLIYASQRANRRVKTHSLLLLTSLLFLAACGLTGGAKTGDKTQLEGEAVLECNQECADRGQCGTTIANQQQVVFGSAGDPAVSNHELVFPAGARVIINNLINQTLQPVAGGESFELTFYHVTVADQSNKSGWIAGWCLAAP